MVSRITGKSYSPDNSSVVWISNMQQVYKYLNNGAETDLVDILYTETKKDCLVFVFRKTPLIAELYRKWQSHEL